MSELVLYNNVLSVCSMKTRLAFVEKGLAWRGHEIDIVKAQEQLQPWYVELNELAVVPTLKDGDKIITNSPGPAFQPGRRVAFPAEPPVGRRKAGPGSLPGA